MAVLALTIIAARRRAEAGRAQSVCTWLALLNLAAFQGGGAWGDYITLGSAWLLTYLATDFGRSRAAAALLAVAWVACLVVPGAQPIPVFLPVPLAMLSTTVIFLVTVCLNAWVLLQRVATPALERPALTVLTGQA